MDKTIRILLADDHPIVRAGVRTILKGHADLQLVGEVDHGRDVEPTVRELQPDVLLLDLNMPELEPAPVTRRLTQALPGLHVLVLTAHDEAEFVVELLAAGAAGYALKDEATDTLVQAIRAVANGDNWFTHRVTQQMARKLEERRSARRRAAEVESLTPREAQVLALIGTGANNREIARALVISKRTVETYVNRIYLKLRLRGRAEAVLYAVEHGLVERDGRDGHATGTGNTT